MIVRYNVAKKWNFPLRIFSVNGNFLRICSHLLKKSLMENFFFCAMRYVRIYINTTEVSFKAVAKLLTYFMPLVLFYTPWTKSENEGFSSRAEAWNGLSSVTISLFFYLINLLILYQYPAGGGSWRKIILPCRGEHSQCCQQRHWNDAQLSFCSKTKILIVNPFPVNVPNNILLNTRKPKFFWYFQGV